MNVVFALIALAAIFVLLGYWLRSKDIRPTWYEWLIGIVGTILLLWTIQISVDSFAEAESKAGTMALLIVGLPSLIMMAVSIILVRRRTSA